jgi:hypothetical protein
MIDRLECRLLCAGAMSAELRGGILTLVGDDSANQITITRASDDRAAYRLLPRSGTTINGSTLPQIFRDATKGLVLELGAGDDHAELLGTYVRGSLVLDAGAGDDALVMRSVRVTGGLRYDGGEGRDDILLRNTTVQGDTDLDGAAGKDRFYLSQVRVGGRLNVADARGGSIITFSVLAVSGESTVATGASIDHLTIHHATFDSDVTITTSRGDDEIRVRGTIFQATNRIDPGSGENRLDREVILEWDFDDGSQGWETGFADYDPVIFPEQDLALEAGIVPAPDFTGFDGNVLRFSGNNFTDDLIMFMTRRLSAADGLGGGQAYRVEFTVGYLSDRPSDSFGQIEYLKVGAVPQRIQRSINPQTGQYDLNLDRGNQASEGVDASVVGQIQNGLADQFVWRAVKRRHVHKSAPTADAQGRLFLFVAAESAFESITVVYFTSVKVKLTPLTTALPRTE